MLLDTPYFKPNGTISCPDPLILFDEACRIPCDIQLHPRQKYLDLYRAGFWIDGAGLVCLALTMLSWVIAPGTVPIKKKILFPCMSSFVLTCTFLIPLIHGAEETFCQDEVTFRGQENGGLCFVQALLVSFFGLSTAIWWFCHIVHLFLRFVVYGLTSQRDYSKHWFYYAIAAYGIPMFTTSALVIGGTLCSSAKRENFDHLSLSLSLSPTLAKT